MTKPQDLPFTVKFLQKHVFVNVTRNRITWGIFSSISLPEPYLRPGEPIFSPEGWEPVFLSLHCRDLARLSFGHCCHSPLLTNPCPANHSTKPVCRGLTLSKVWTLSSKNKSFQNGHLAKCLCAFQHGHE